MSNDEAPGTSSSYYSTSSSSSSVENISSGGTSTIENGELSFLTFVVSPSRAYTSDQRLSPVSHLPKVGGHSCVHVAGCHCSCRRSNSRLSDAESQDNLAIDPFRMPPHHRLICNSKLHFKPNKICQDAMFSDSSYSPSPLDGLVLKSLEKGALYPVIHWSSKMNEGLTQNFQFDCANVVVNQGVYKELKRVIPPDAWIHKSDSVSKAYPKKPTWLMIGYKSLEKTLDSSLEASWKEWTGCRHIYLNLRNDFEIRRISFYTKVCPEDNLDLFMYIVFMEIGNVDDGNLMWLLDFVQRIKIHRMKGFISVYASVENDFSTIGEEYFRYFATEISKSKSSESIPDAATQEINGNLKFIEKLLEEIHQSPLVDYF